MAHPGARGTESSTRGGHIRCVIISFTLSANYRGWGEELAKTGSRGFKFGTENVCVLFGRTADWWKAVGFFFLELSASFVFFFAIIYA